MTKLTLWLLALVLVVGGLWAAYSLLTPASNDRDWEVDQARLPEISFAGEMVTIRHIRHFTYRTKADYTPGYYDRTFDLGEVDTVWLMVEPFRGYRGAAHTLLSFGFRDGRYLAISVEIRKERGETFSAVQGLFRRFELMYVIADEADVIHLRANHRKHDVFLYPMRATAAQARSLLVDMLQRAQQLQTTPEHYHTLLSNCTTNLVDHVNKLVPNRVGFDWRIVLPAEVDDYAYQLGLIATDLPFAQARTRFQINRLADGYSGEGDFSQRIRAVDRAR